MAIFEWRKFNFFDLKPQVDRGIIQSSLADDARITTTTYGNGQVIIGDSSGMVYVFKKDWSFVPFKAHDGPVLLSKFCRLNSMLVTVGEDQVEGCCFKVWNLSKCIRDGQPPGCVRCSKIAVQTPTAIDVSENGQLLAIGFGTGGVSLYKGDLARDKVKSSKNLSGGLTAVTGLAFKTAGKLTLLYVCTKQDVLVYNIQGSRDKETRVVLQHDSPEKPSPIRCSTLQLTGSRSFLVGRDSAIYCFDNEDMGPCYALDGLKSTLECFRTYIVIVLKPNKSKPAGSKESILTVIDIRNKIIVHTSPIDNVAGIFIEFGSCYILTQQKELLVLDEKDLEAKLSLLFKKSLYDIAVRVAKNNEYDSSSLAQILRAYGDHLYAKNDFVGAVDQYIKTIGHLEPSYVIMKYLDSRHIDCLTTYLEALHRSGKATADHTTLLLNCFTRLDRVDEAKQFLQNEGELKYDVDIAIQVCRSASVEHALELAVKHKKHRHCISILVEDLKDHQKALEYISRLSVDEAESSLSRYGSELMRHCPRQLTELLKRNCVDYSTTATGDAANRGGVGNQGDENKQQPVELDSIYDVDERKRGDPENYLHLFADAPEYLVEFLEYLMREVPNCSSKLVFNSLLENYLEQWSKVATTAETKVVEKISSKILDLLEKQFDSCDRSQVLMLCRLYDYVPGILWVYEGDQLYHLIVRHYMREGEYNKLLDTCARLGKRSPSLWLQALSGLREDAKAPADIVTEILGVIGQQKLQSPLQVLKSLVAEPAGVGDGPKLGAVRNYFTQVFRHEEELYTEEGESVEKFRRDGQKWKEHIENLQELPIEFKGSNCSNCSQPLAIPAIYYFCQHAFHLDCVRAYTEADSGCPACQAKNAGIVDKLKAQQSSRNVHDEFHTYLERSQDPFSFVAEYFQRGLFNKIVLFDENEATAMKRTPERRQQQQKQQIQQMQQQQQQEIKRPPIKAQPNSLAFGSGAEAKMRVAENRSNVIAAPQSEARMRLQEQSRGSKVGGGGGYSSSLEANIDWSVARSKPAVGNIKNPVAVVKAPISYPRRNNPFGDEEEATEKEVAGTNPFGEDDEEEEAKVVVEKKTEVKKGLNPFGDDDEEEEDEDVSNNNPKNLNPFDE